MHTRHFTEGKLGSGVHISTISTGPHSSRWNWWNPLLGRPPNPLVEMVEIISGLVPNTMVEIVEKTSALAHHTFCNWFNENLTAYVNVIIRFCQKMSTTLNCERITFIVSWLGDLYAATFSPLSKTIWSTIWTSPTKHNEKQDPKNSHLDKKKLM